MSAVTYLTQTLPADHVLELKDTLSRPAQESYGSKSRFHLGCIQANEPQLIHLLG